MPAPSLDDIPVPAVLKVHRLGRISFRKIKEKRDYLGKRKSAPNWMYLSRLAAKKEWQFLQVSRKETDFAFIFHNSDSKICISFCTNMAFLFLHQLHILVTQS